MYDPTTRENYMALDIKEDEYSGTIFAFPKGCDDSEAKDTVVKVVEESVGKLHASHTKVFHMRPEIAASLMQRGYVAFDIQSAEQLSLL